MTTASPPSLVQAAQKRAQHMARALEQLADMVQHNPLGAGGFQEWAIQLSQCAAPHSRTAHFIAVGKSALVAQTLVAMLVSVGISARFLHPTEALHGDLGSVRPHDFCLLISYGGKSNEILDILPSLEKRGAHCVALTSQENSPLARKCTRYALLPLVEEACPLSQAPVTSTVLTLAFGQLLVAATMEHRQLALQQYAQNHPGGAIGKRIFVAVDDMMRSLKETPVLLPSADFKTCLSGLTTGAMGAVLVRHTDSMRLMGMITEKDLRVAIETKGPEVFNATAQDMMNTAPLTIFSQTLAADALRFMENRPNPLNVLPVVDLQHNIKGLLRIHDLIAAGF